MEEVTGLCRVFLERRDNFYYGYKALQHIILVTRHNQVVGIMSEGVAACVFSNSRSMDCYFDLLLNGASVDVMTAFDARARILTGGIRRKNVLPI